MRATSFAVLSLLAACGGASSAPPPEPPSAEPRRASVADTGADQARACVEAASIAPFAQFTAPVASPAFRAHLSSRIDDLRCCFTDARRESLHGASVRLTFAPRTGDPADGATATLHAPLDEARPVERQCLGEIVSRWTMAPAPVSDVVRVPFDPRISTRSDAASLSIAHPF